MIPTSERGLPAAYAAARFEYRSRRTLFGLPLVHVVYGPAWLVGFRPARGIIAVGNVAVGVVAVGGFALGAIAFGGIGLGLVCLGGIALGLGLGLGGIATGFWALGGIAVGVHILGGLGLPVLKSGPQLASVAASLMARRSDRS